MFAGNFDELWRNGRTAEDTDSNIVCVNSLTSGGMYKFMKREGSIAWAILSTGGGGVNFVCF
jgi:hypothetical protein